MPFKHRLMTLRDDLVFLIFLYQLYIYKVDTSRADEYGFVHAMDEKAAVDGKEKQTEARQQAIEAQVAQMLEDSDSDDEDELESTVKEAEGSAGEVAVAEPAKAEVAVDADLGATEQAFEWVPPMVALQRRKDRFRQQCDELFQKFETGQACNLNELLNTIAEVRGKELGHLETEQIRAVWRANGDRVVSKEEFFCRLIKLAEAEPEQFDNFLRAMGEVCERWV